MNNNTYITIAAIKPYSSFYTQSKVVKTLDEAKEYLDNIPEDYCAVLTLYATGDSHGEKQRTMIGKIWVHNNKENLVVAESAHHYSGSINIDRAWNFFNDSTNA